MRKIALVHDWLTLCGGAERVLEQILLLYPEADLYGLVDFLPLEQRSFLQGKPVHTSFIQNLPFARQHYRRYLGLMPLAIEALDLSAYDLIISSSYAVAKGALTGPDQLHVSYIHSPIRYAWDMQHAYLSTDQMTTGFKSRLALALLHYIRLWDQRTANGVDVMVAGSRYVARRIYKIYRREPVLIPPPVDVLRFPYCEEKQDYYLVVCRLVQYKRVDLIVEAFNGLPDRQLVVIGDGPELKQLTQRAGPNIRVLGYQSNEMVSHYMMHARAFVYAAQEDFGIVLLEAQACGTPVIAYGRGGAAETIRSQDLSQPTGYLFSEQSVAGLQEAVRQYERMVEQISYLQCRQNAIDYAPERFREKFAALIEDSWEKFQRQRFVGI